MTDQNEQAREVLEFSEGLRIRTRIARNGSWFALIVFGVIVLVAMTFYDSPYSPMSTSKGPFGNGLGSSAGTILGVSPWATTYWVISIFVGICAVIAYYWARSRSSGVAGRIWPFATIGVAVLALAVASRGWKTLGIPGDFWIRGVQALLVIAVGLVALAVIERSWPFLLFVAGFFGLALLSCLYNVSNLFVRFGIGATWNGNDQGLPNLILPGIYLLVGGAAFYLFRRKGIALHIVFHVVRQRTINGE
jgi:hypothetical protein